MSSVTVSTLIPALLFELPLSVIKITKDIALSEFLRIKQKKSCEDFLLCIESLPECPAKQVFIEQYQHLLTDFDFAYGAYDPVCAFNEMSDKLSKLKIRVQCERFELESRARFLKNIEKRIQGLNDEKLAHMLLPGTLSRHEQEEILARILQLEERRNIGENQLISEQPVNPVSAEQRLKHARAVRLFDLIKEYDSSEAESVKELYETSLQQNQGESLHLALDQMEFVFSRLKQRISEDQILRPEILKCGNVLKNVKKSEEISSYIDSILNKKYIEQKDFDDVCSRMHAFCKDFMENSSGDSAYHIAESLRAMGYSILDSDACSMAEGKVVHIAGESPYGIMLKLSNESELSARLICCEGKAGTVSYEESKEQDAREKWCSDFDYLKTILADKNITLCESIRKDEPAVRVKKIVHKKKQMKKGQRP